MQTANIKGFFNPRTDGDTFQGLNSSIDGAIADRIISDPFDFLKAAGRDYYIQKAPAGVFDPHGAIDATGAIVPGWQEVPNQFHLVRSSDGRVVSPHTVSEQYSPLSLMDVAEEIRPWFDQGFVSPDGVYSGRNESLEILTLRVNDDDIDMPEGERFAHYIVFQNPHGSGGTAKGKIISFRIVCANTFAAAVSATCDFAISHRVAQGDAEAQRAIMAARVKSATDAWQRVQTHFKQMGSYIERSLSIKLSAKQAENLTDRLLGISDPAKVATKTKNRRDAIMAGFNAPNLGTRGETGWDWINAVTSYTSNGQKGSKVSQLERNIRNMDPNGTGFKLEATAEKLLASLA